MAVPPVVTAEEATRLYAKILIDPEETSLSSAGASKCADAPGELADAAPQGAERASGGLSGINGVRGPRVLGLHDLLCDEVVVVHGSRVARFAARGEWQD